MGHSTTCYDKRNKKNIWPATIFLSLLWFQAYWKWQKLYLSVLCFYPGVIILWHFLFQKPNHCLKKLQNWEHIVIYYWEVENKYTLIFMYYSISDEINLKNVVAMDKKNEENNFKNNIETFFDVLRN